MAYLVLNLIFFPMNTAFFWKLNFN
jgi:hypothetical protein